MDIVLFIYLFSCRWRFGCFPVLGQFMNELLGTHLCMSSFFFFFGEVFLFWFGFGFLWGE